MTKRTFRTDRELKALKPKTDWYDVWDNAQRGLAVRVGPKTARANFGAPSLWWRALMVPSTRRAAL